MTLTARDASGGPSMEPRHRVALTGITTEGDDISQLTLHRQAHGLTCEALDLLAGWPRGTCRHLESGGRGRQPSYKRLLQWRRVLGVEVHHVHATRHSGFTAAERCAESPDHSTHARNSAGSTDG